MLKYSSLGDQWNVAGVVQLVECLLAKEKVVGSNPIARSDKHRSLFVIEQASVCF